MRLRGTSAPRPVTISLNRSRSSPARIASMLAPISSTLYSLQDALVVQGHGRVQRGLAAQGGEHGVRALDGDDLLQRLGGDRLDVGGVGELGVGHDRRRVGVDQADPDALGLQHPARLGARVVELAALPDDDRAGPDHQHRLQVLTPRHGSPPVRRSRRWTVRCRSLATPNCDIGASSGALEQGAEVIEVVRGVVRAGSGLRVVLHAEHRALEQAQALHHAVVEVDVADHRRAVGRARTAAGPAPARATRWPAPGRGPRVSAETPALLPRRRASAGPCASPGSAAAKPWLWLVM